MTARLSPLPDTTQRLADAVYDRLGAAILEGELPGGSRVRDAEVAAQLGVSRMPVREALQRLQRIGLVEMSPGRYTRVTEVTPRLARESFEFLGYQVGIAARMSVTRMDDAARRHTLGMIDELLGLIDDPARYDEAAGRLFHHLAAHTRNPVYVGVIGECLIALTRNLRGARPMWGTAAQIAAHLAELRDAVRDGDGDAAERTIRRRHALTGA